MHQNYLFCIHYVSTSIYLVILTRKGILPRSLFHTQHLHSMYHKLCYLSFYFQFSSVAQSCLTLCDPMNLSRQASLSVTSSQNSLRLKSIESVMPSNQLILCHPLLFLSSVCPSIRVFSSESALRIRWPKYWLFSFNISPSNEHPGLISFRMDWLEVA